MQKSLKRKLIVAITILGSLWPNLIAMKAKKLFPSVKKINKDLYVGKVGEKFYVAMEQINQDNIDKWTEYARIQVSAGSHKPLKYLSSSDDSGHFLQVLKFYRDGKITSDNELWIAYASSRPVTGKAKKLGLCNPFIEMFVTVVTSPDALITSHMGISRTWKTAYDLQQKPPRRRKHPYQSVHLHSFAAKVMKLKNPRRKYMLTAPNPVMRNILLKKMPKDSIFVGDNLYQKELEEIEKDPKAWLIIRDLEIEGELHEDRDKRLNQEAEEMYRDFKCEEKNRLLKTNPPRIRITDQQFTIQKPDKTTFITFKKSTPVYQWMFTDPYRSIGLTCPYVLIDLDALSVFETLEQPKALIFPIQKIIGH